MASVSFGFYAVIGRWAVAKVVGVVAESFIFAVLVVKNTPASVGQASLKGNGDGVLGSG